MTIETPKIDERIQSEVLHEIASLVPFYTPEWTFNGKDFGFALITLFSQMLSDVIRQLNKVPLKNFTAFLDLIGTSLLPAHAATAPISFMLAEGTKNHVLIPRQTQITAGDIIFETVQNIYATPSRLVNVFCVDPAHDYIFQAPSNIFASASENPFESKLLYASKARDNEIYLNNIEGLSIGDTICIENDDGTINEYNIVSKVLDSGIKLLYELENNHSKNDTLKKVMTFELLTGKNRQQHILYLGHKELFNIKSQAKLEIIFSESISELTNSLLICWQYWGERAVNGTKKLDWYDFKIENSSENVQLLKNNIDEIKEYEINSMKSFWIRCIVKPSQINRLKDIQIDAIKISIPPKEAGEGIKPDILFLNDIPFNPNEPFPPFGEIPRLFSTFYIASKEAFTKKNLFIKIQIELDNLDVEDSGFKLSWEYWNGKGWVVIKSLEDGTNNLAKAGDVFFPCPDDILPTLVNGQENDWIRLKIVEGGYFQTNFALIPEDIFIYYDANYPCEKIDAPETLSNEIKQALNDKGLISKIGGAEELKAFMENKKYGIVIMAMDIAPDTIFNGEHVLIARDWLSNGGRMIWLGMQEFDFYGKSGGWYAQIGMGNEGAQLIFDLKSSITNYNYSSTERIRTTPLAKDIIPSLEDFDSNFPAIIERMQAEGLVYEIYAEDSTGIYADPVLFRRPQPQYGAFVKFHMHDITDNINEIKKIADQLGEFVYNRFFTLKYARVPSEIYSPVISNIQIFYSSEDNNQVQIGQFGQYCLIKNNLTFKNVSEESRASTMTFNPFQQIDIEYYQEDQSLQLPALYFGFNQKLEKGPISLYFSLREEKTPRAQTPKIKWFYYTQSNEWLQLEGVDNTDNLTRSGTIQFLVPTNFEKKSQFGVINYWLKAVDIERKFQFRPEIKGIYLNTVAAIQAETIKDELLGSSDGTAQQTFRLKRYPIIDEQIWVNEINTLTTEQKEKFIQENGENMIIEIKDETGNVIEDWIQWRAIDDFIDSDSEGRHFLLNYPIGEIIFGDGIYGKIPPLGKDNIKATYLVGGGKQGNVGVGEISTLKSSIPFVESAINPEPAGGGADIELMENVFRRGPHLIRHRNRAVTTEDFERLAASASNYIARTKCIVIGNSIKVIVIPHGEEKEPTPSPVLLTKVEKYLAERCINSILADSIEVIKPEYISINIKAVIIPQSIEIAVPLEKEVREKLQAFFHPLTGGSDKNGWDFGRDVHISDVYALLEGIPGVDHVEQLFINDKDADCLVDPLCTVSSGIHSIDMKIGG